MLFTSSLLRLDALLCANAIALPADVRATLDLNLQRLLAQGDVAAIKNAAHHIKSVAASTMTPLKQSLAFEAVAAYLGARDWNTLRARVENAGFTLAARDREGILHFERNAEKFARFVFELQSKRIGTGNFAPLFKRSPALRIRLLSRYSPDIHPVVDTWLRQANNPAFPTGSELMRHRAEFMRATATYEASFQDRSARATRHFVIVEVRVTEALARAADEPAAQGVLAEERSRLMRDLENALEAKLGLASTETVAGFENCDLAPTGSLEPWVHCASFTQVSGARSQFDALIDLAQAEEIDAEAGFTAVRHGIVFPPKAPTGRLERLKQTLGLAPSAKLLMVDPRYVLATSPWAGPVAGVGTTGLLLQQREHGPARIAPWGTAAAEHFLVLSSSGGGKTFVGREVLTQALAHGKRVRVIGMGREYPTFVREVLGGSVFELDIRKPVSVNPFSGVASTTTFEALRSAMAALLHELLALDDVAALPILEAGLSAAWLAHKEHLDITHIGTALASADTPASRALGALVAQLAETTGPWLCGESQLPLNDAALLIELDSIQRASPPVVAALERAVLGLLHLEALANPRPSVHLYEELYRFAPSAQYARRMAHDCRVCGTSIGLTAQSLRDIVTEELGKGFFRPEMTILQLYLRSSDDSCYESHLRLSETELELLKRLRPHRRSTQLALIRQGRVEGVFEFALEPFTKLAYATSAREWSRILERVRKGDPYMNAVRSLAAEELEREGL